MTPCALSLVAFFTIIFPASSSLSGGCLELKGIESGGGKGLLDLDVVNTTVEKEPFDFELAPIGIVAGCSSVLETPISMRNLLGIDTAAFSVAMMFHPNPNALDIFGDKNQSDARRRCYPDSSATTATDVSLFDLHLRVAILYLVSYGGRLSTPSCAEEIDASMNDLGLNMSLILEGNATVETPWGLAKTYLDETFAYLLENDGWNADGSMSRTYNKIPFSDYEYHDSDGKMWKPYTPDNSPWEFKKTKRWQPLIEHDDLGYLYSQMHVTPHIGALARFYGFNSTQDETNFGSRQLEDPKYEELVSFLKLAPHDFGTAYSYDKASLEVLEESRLMATDEFKQASIAFFDNKFSSLVPLKIAYFLRDPDDNSPQDFYRVTLLNQLAIYNGVILSWREKVRHDLPRPPSVITSLYGDSLFETYAGPGQGVQMIKASEWEPFIRTMPHSEFPSASACICQMFAEQMVDYTGSDTIDPPLVFPLTTSVTLEFSSWSEVSDLCGNGRLWGGMHFPDAVPAGAGLCGGGLVASSMGASVDRLISGDETAAIFKYNPGELKVRSYK